MIRGHCLLGLGVCKRMRSKIIIGFIVAAFLFTVFSVDCAAVDDNMFISLIKAWETNEFIAFDTKFNKIIDSPKKYYSAGVVLTHLISEKMLVTWQLKIIEDLIVSNVYRNKNMGSTYAFITEFYYYLLKDDDFREKLKTIIKEFNRKNWANKISTRCKYEIIKTGTAYRLLERSVMVAGNNYLIPPWLPHTTFSLIIKDLAKLKPKFDELSELRLPLTGRYSELKYHHLVTYIEDDYWKVNKGGCILKIKYIYPEDEKWNSYKADPRAEYKLDWFIKNGGRLLVSIQTFNKKLGNSILDIIKKHFEPYRMSEK